MRVLLAIVSLLIGVGCADGGPVATPCNQDAECTAPLVCRQGTCTALEVAACGDGVTDDGETCDDGNTVSGDGCSAVCAVEEDCDGPSCTAACVVAGVGYDEGALSPASACLVCAAASSTTSFTALPDDTTCAGPDACGTVGVCAEGACEILEGCGGETPVCDAAALRCVCGPSSCDDGAYCNGKETCGDDGTCAPGEAVLCEAPTPHCDDEKRACIMCRDDKDCGDDNPTCLDGTCVACPTCPCPIGLHDGGDGVCVPVTTCSDGFARAYVDADGDGVGAGDPSLACLPLPFGPGTSTSGTDCDDGEASVSTGLGVFPDVDGDGYTGDLVDICVGDTLPDWARETPTSPPRVSLRARDATNVSGGMGTLSWQNLTEIREADGVGIFCRPFTEGCRYVVIRRLDLAIDDDAVITGFAVDLIRRASDDTVGVIHEGHVQLAPALTPSGENRADTTTSWPFEYTPRTYGGPGDTWGLALTPSIVNDSDFGIAVSVWSSDGLSTAAGRIDAIRVRVFTDEPLSDCADDDATRASWRPLRTDQDGDGFVVPGSLDEDCVGDALPDGRVQHNFGDDCYDLNGNARPGQTAYFGSHRGDGSFDYNCSGGVSKESVTVHTACACAETTCDVTGSTSITPAPGCGSNVNVDRCSSDCLSCTLGAQAVQVRCR